MLLLLEKGQKIRREDITRRLVEILYERNDGDFRRGTFRVRGDVIEVYPTYDEKAYRIELFGDEIESLSQIDPLFGTVRQKYARLPIYPKIHYVVQPERKKTAIESILEELAWWEKELESQGRLVESQRIHQRTRFDLEMIKSVGYCHGIENYSRHFSGRLPGEPPPTLLDYFPRDYLLFIDESHVTVPQLHGMWHGDRSRKQNLVDYGFRLPSAMDNRPLKFEEFETRTNQIIYVSATPGPYELTKSAGVVVEQIIRPTGLVDPEVEIRPIRGQIDDLLAEIRDRAAKKRARSGHHAHQAHGRRSRPATTPRSGCDAATCTRRSRPWSACACCAICAGASTTCSSASTCCAKGSICLRFRWSRFSMRIRKDSCALRLADPDHRPRRPPHQWPRHPLCG